MSAAVQNGLGGGYAAARAPGGGGRQPGRGPNRRRVIGDVVVISDDDDDEPDEELSTICDGCANELCENGTVPLSYLLAISIMLRNRLDDLIRLASHNQAIITPARKKVGNVPGHRTILTPAFINTVARWRRQLAADAANPMRVAPEAVPARDRHARAAAAVNTSPAAATPPHAPNNSPFTFPGSASSSPFGFDITPTRGAVAPRGNQYGR
ncbi:hypothetical protein N0V82_010006 [Gnomoniopsis sp. IMI 355080]|nr:hypothetical protein N0V82_010006 [Gnomoniopsis sp. IMI 355080]